ncbi:MAG: hypothetical protein GWN86_11700 [Desulfobacterales bacterium]|nr:hypothetical protein [Desulfobacterales bacterium]
MRRSKLEMHIDVLKVLAQKGPLKLTHIMYKANVNCSVLKEFLDFLIDQNLVEERDLGEKRTVYAIKDRGLRVLKYFREVRALIPLGEEEPQKIPAQLL